MEYPVLYLRRDGRSPPGRSERGRGVSGWADRAAAPLVPPPSRIAAQGASRTCRRFDAYASRLESEGHPAVEHVVFFTGADGAAQFRRLPSLEDAVRFVEHLRNVEGVEDPRVFALA